MATTETTSRQVDHFSDQTSTLLGLPAELMNQILELVLADYDPDYEPDYDTHVEILARPVKGRVGVHYHFEPAVPPILQVCRQIRAASLVMYYASNKFRITDALTRRPRAFEDFTLVRSPGFDHVRYVNVVHCVNVVYAEQRGRHRITQEVKEVDVCFEAMVTSSSISITVASVYGAITFAGFPHGQDFCWCTVRSMAAEETPGPGMLKRFLLRFFAMSEVQSEFAYLQCKGGGIGAKTCVRCKSTMAFPAPESLARQGKANGNENRMARLRGEDGQVKKFYYR